MIIGGKQKQVGQLVQTVQELKCKKKKYGSTCRAVPGYDVKVLKSDSSVAKPNEMGDIVKTSLPPEHFNFMEC